MYKPTAVYIATDTKGDVLYVGQSLNPGSRFAQHRDAKTWWRQVANLEVRWTNTPKQADQLERQLVRDLDPPHNVHLRRTSLANDHTPASALVQRSIKKKLEDEAAALRCGPVETTTAGRCDCGHGDGPRRCDDCGGIVTKAA